MHDALKCVQTNRKKTQKRNLLLKTEIRESDVEFALIISSFTKPGMPGCARKTVDLRLSVSLCCVFPVFTTAMHQACVRPRTFCICFCFSREVKRVAP